MENKKLAKELSGLKKKLKDLADYNCICENCQVFRSLLSDFKKSELQEILVAYIRIVQVSINSVESKKFSSYIG